MGARIFMALCVFFMGGGCYKSSNTKDIPDENTDTDTGGNMISDSDDTDSNTQDNRNTDPDSDADPDSDTATATATDTAVDTGAEGDIDTGLFDDQAARCNTDEECHLHSDCCNCVVLGKEEVAPPCSIPECKIDKCSLLPIGEAAALCSGGFCVFDINCDDNNVTCKIMKPECDHGSVPAVNLEGDCWTDDCIETAKCRRISDCADCTDSQVCVTFRSPIAFFRSCVPVSDECINDRSCSCMGEQVCRELSCNDSGDHLGCHWLMALSAY